MNEAIKLAIEKGGYKSRQPQEWIKGHYSDKGYYYTQLYSKGLLYTLWVDTYHLGDVNKLRWYLKDGYAVATVNGKKVRMHHLLMGKPPVGKEVDHINRCRTDNRRSNLRFVSSSVNGHNRKVIGVRKHGGLWEANICVNYEKHFKSFKTLKEAKQWRQQMKEKYLKSLNK